MNGWKNSWQEYQADFRCNRSGIDQIFTFKRITNELLRYVVLVDFNQNVNRIYREKM